MKNTSSFVGSRAEAPGGSTVKRACSGASSLQHKGTPQFVCDEFYICAVKKQVLKFPAARIKLEAVSFDI